MGRAVLGLANEGTPFSASGATYRLQTEHLTAIERLGAINGGVT